MDKMNIVSGVLFLAADCFAIASLVIQRWIVTKTGGSTSFGLLQTCLTVHDRPTRCTPLVHYEWLITFAFICAGVISITMTIALLIYSRWRPLAVKYAQILGFVALIMFCLASVIFPIGFMIEEIGGQAFQLPQDHTVGIAYIFFVLSLWITVVSELFAGKVCLPHF